MKPVSPGRAPHGPTGMPAKAKPRPGEYSGDVEDGEGRNLPVGAGAALSGSEVKIADKKHVVLGYLALGKEGD